MSRGRSNLLLAALAGAVAVAPLLLPLGDAGFKGSDDQAASIITGNAPDYRPWAKPWWTPPSGEVESLLFSLQAALGAGIIGYYLGLRQGQRQRRQPGGGSGPDSKGAAGAGD